MPNQEPSLSVDEARQLLRDQGLRCTSCRVAVVRHLAGADSPLSHNEVADALEGDGFDKSTIYRSLVELSDAGLANRLDLGDHTYRFELIDEGPETYHPHFLCIDCGEVSCIPEIEVRVNTQTTPRPSALGTITEILLKGHCPNCK